MSDERLSEETLDELMERCLRYATSDLLMSKEMGRLLTELRTLRAAMPTAEERAALVELADEVRSLFPGQPQAELAVAALDKITKGGA